jgi:hypothetical protein
MSSATFFKSSRDLEDGLRRLVSGFAKTFQQFASRFLLSSSAAAPSALARPLPLLSFPLFRKLPLTVLG